MKAKDHAQYVRENSSLVDGTRTTLIFKQCRKILQEIPELIEQRKAQRPKAIYACYVQTTKKLTAFLRTLNAPKYAVRDLLKDFWGPKTGEHLFITLENCKRPEFNLSPDRFNEIMRIKGV